MLAYGHVALPSLLVTDPAHPLAAAILGIARIAEGAPRLLVVDRLDRSYDVVADSDGPDACSATAWPLRDLLRELILAARVAVEVREAPEPERTAQRPPACRPESASSARRTAVPQLLRATLAATRARIVAGEIAREP
ncbi:MAG: hypothetical protein HKL92_04385 [Candidatus Eremiobacteraeota bacterium]|nr:hypothetical protein [Candidatus Eremiobacteraeota bacterium]